MANGNAVPTEGRRRVVMRATKSEEESRLTTCVP